MNLKDFILKTDEALAMEAIANNLRALTVAIKQHNVFLEKNNKLLEELKFFLKKKHL